MNIKKMLSWLFTAVLAVVLICGSAIVLVPRIMGNGCYAVVSGSMEPALPLGALVLTQDVAFEDIKAGDIITFASKDNKSFFSHRIVEKDSQNQLLYTKGDANKYGDPSPSSYQYATGKVIKVIPFIGFIKIAFTSVYGVAAVGALALIYVVAGVTSSVKKHNKNKENQN